jgi:16S rRNA (guanine966-N2)-methyltransferase
MRHLNEQKRKTRGSPSGRLRIVAGKWRSRLLPVANVTGLRPTSERIRETLFNWLAPFLDGARCLDLFAGTGALGLEALSRGASSAEFVENSGVAVKALRESLVLLDATGATIHEMSALSYIRKDAPHTFDIVFLDPPFAADLAQELCRLLTEHGWLAQGAHVYLEQDRSQRIPILPASWNLLREKTAGNVRYSLIRIA